MRKIYIYFEFIENFFCLSFYFLVMLTLCIIIIDLLFGFNLLESSIKPVYDRIKVFLDSWTVTVPNVDSVLEKSFSIEEESVKFEKNEDQKIIHTPNVSVIQTSVRNPPEYIEPSSTTPCDIALTEDEESFAIVNVKNFAKKFDNLRQKNTFNKDEVTIPLSVIKENHAKKLTEEKSVVSTKFIAKRGSVTRQISKQDIHHSAMNKSDSNRSIIDRISSIHENENKWKKRLSRIPNDIINARPLSVYDIQEQLYTTQTNWKSRIEQKDVTQFTTEAKLLSVQSKEPQSEISSHENIVKDNESTNICVVRLTKSEKLDMSPIKITIQSNSNLPASNNSATACSGVLSQCANNNDVSLFSDHNRQRRGLCHKVTVPQMSDESLLSFFNDTEQSTNDDETLNAVHTTNDFDDIFLPRDNKLNIQKRSLKPIRKTKTVSKNPLKKLNERLDIVAEYDEITYDVTESQVKHQKLENAKVNEGFTKEALAALSSKEDFSRVKLKSADSGNMCERFVSPYKDLMLISVKGRKKVQLRLIEPSASSINCGDCYLLVTATCVFVWQGVCANVIELNKVNELGSWIAKCKDLNYKGLADKPTVVKSNDSPTNPNVIKFWSSLKSDNVQQFNNPGAADEDEIYEHRIQTTNMVFQVVNNQLIPLDEYWGHSLKYNMLLDNKVYMFDFGSEIYLWSGSKTSLMSRRQGKALLQELWLKGYDYEQCSINPLDPLPESLEKTKPKKWPSRPDWVIAGKLSQKGETILFKEKFSDWPESSRLINVSNSTPICQEKKLSESDLQPIDLDELFNITHPSVNMTIDGKCVGRGGYWKVMECGILREFDICTKNVEAWYINDNEAIQIEGESLGQFFNGDAYIIRWDFEVKTLGRFQRNQATGNVTSVYFFWQGSETTVTDKTASALHTMNLDKDKVTQIRVKQHQESPAFCRLFDGSMMIYHGKRKDVHKDDSSTRLFILRGEIKEESHFVEVKCVPESLRDRTSFLLLNKSVGNAYLWHGRLSSERTKLCARYCIECIKKKRPYEFGLIDGGDINIEEVNQGAEHRLFWRDIGAVKRWRSSNLSTSLEPIRGWLVSSVTTSFDLLPLTYSLNPDDGSIASLPLLQCSLFHVNQPALFIISAGPHLYLWQGWWPHLATSSATDGESDTEKDSTIRDWAIPKNRIAAEKLAALKSVNTYLLKHKSDGVSASIIYAGLEPTAFQELFPFWEVNEIAKFANIKKGYQMFQEDDITETLNKYMTETFTIDRLQKRPLPECVILSKIEWFLHDNEFQSLFKMSKEEFYKLSMWKQIEKKKEVNLF